MGGSPRNGDVYVAVPPTPQSFTASAFKDGQEKKKKLTLTERYALEEPYSKRENPLHTASIASILSTHWLQPLVSLGAQKILEKEDLWPVCPTDSCDALETRFQKLYEHRVNKTTSQPPQSRGKWWKSRFALALLRAFQREIFYVFVNYVIYIAAMVFQPLLAQAMLDYLNDRENMFSISNGYVLVVLMAAVSFVGVTCLNFGFFSSSRIGANMRSVTMDAVYQKALRLSSVARQSYTTGEIVTLMSVDTERIFNAIISGPWLFVAPLAFVITIVLIATMFDVIAAISGAVLLIVVLYTSIKLADRIGDVQEELLRVVEERVKVTSEALQGIRVMKFYAWEDSLARRVEKIRTIEVKLYRRFHYLNIINTTLLFLTPVLLGALILGVYVTVAGTLTVTESFTLIALVNISRLAVSLFPLAVASISQAETAFSRMDTYMESDELRLKSPSSPLLLESSTSHQEKSHEVKGSISIRNANFIWSSAAETTVPEVVVDKTESASISDASPAVEVQKSFTLDGVNVEVDAGSLVMIVGTVGSGKTSLLNALLGEMVRLSGTCEVSGEVSYVSQEAWIRNSSVKDNILFESPFDADRYEQVLEATQLALDLHALPNGDQTEIGERGINMSGGQKARVSIARAMYRRDYDILVLDDPLSAVDPHVAHAIFNQCIVGLAKDKTRLLVLNSHYDLLVHADKILVVQDGRIAGDGKFDEVIAQFPDLGSQSAELTKLEKDMIDEHDTDEVEQVKGHEAAHAAAFSADNASSSVGVTVEVSKSEAKDSSSNEDPARLVQEEDRVKGRVSGNTYRTYFDETGFNGILVVIVLISIYAAAQGLRIAADWWQGYWAKQMSRKGVDPTYSDAWYALWYFGFIVACAVITLGRGLLLMEACIRTAKNMHDELFRHVLSAPVNRYFDITPVGRILNRFSNDLDQVDSNLPVQYQNLFQALVVFVGCLVVCGMASYWVAVSYIPMLFIFVITGLYFKRTSREIKRLEGITRTPVFNLFGETLNGLHTIRAFKMQDKFVELNKSAVDHNTSFYFTYWAAGRWLAVRLDWLSVAIIFVVSLYIIASKGSIAPLVAGISITYSLMLTSMVQWCVRAVDMTDNAMTSVERLLHFRTIPTESDGSECTPINPAAWPSNGSIRFDNLCLKYRPELPLVLRGVNMEIAGGEKVGICGRTGAGKSSLMIALFRICEFESGSLFIDGVDISQLKLRELRRSLAIIPQDPVLFSGSLRENLDPYGDYSDDAIWNVLKQVHLADAVTKWGAGLEFIVSECGDNLSVGQRQLVCIGRALLKDSKIVVLDEATANVDTATDNLIQATIKETFRSKTVLIIAHRINTILHCDKIAVMDAGQVAEFGSPSALLSQSESIFSSLAKRSLQKSSSNSQDDD
ncbi:hypothetical protein Poli38472_009778 [Pythium oligandrum]|uniref:Uncharacterized protein n=1 Tax=Pythium oligandrum TaxID=41045 RepID=A0A8K1CGG5_PYTOL|nr:hypothetical protein Poli38472_009778 [Pythium oligandrum]|eukprot:TMW62285.1 hypothetical protein Poli38472_009778 [Pythium oligandrum]